MRKSDEKQGYILYKSWTPVICSLSDSEAGQLFKAIARYQDTGDICDEIGKTYLSGIFEMMRISFDQDKKKYDETCEKRKESGRAGGKASAQKRAQEKRNEGNRSNQNNQMQPNACSSNQTGANQPDLGLEKDIGSDSDFGKDKKTDPLDHANLSNPVREALRTWLEYKVERREGYKAAGLKTLVSRAEKAESQHGATAVVRLIEDCISSGYRGIIWDRLDRSAARGGGRTAKVNQFTQMENQHDYDFDALEKELLEN